MKASLFTMTRRQYRPWRTSRTATAAPARADNTSSVQLAWPPVSSATRDTGWADSSVGAMADATVGWMWPGTVKVRLAAAGAGAAYSATTMVAGPFPR